MSAEAEDGDAGMGVCLFDVLLELEANEGLVLCGCVEGVEQKDAESAVGRGGCVIGEDAGRHGWKHRAGIGGLVGVVDFEVVNGLRSFVFGDGEVLRAKPVDGFAVGVFHNDVDDDELRTGREGVLTGLRSWLRLLRWSLRERSQREKCAKCQCASRAKTVGARHHGCTNCSGGKLQGKAKGKDKGQREGAEDAKERNEEQKQMQKL